MQLAKEIGITQKSARFVLHRLREACGSDLKKLSGIIEIDETFVGGIEANKHKKKKLKAGRGTVGNSPVLGMRERDNGTIKQSRSRIRISNDFTGQSTSHRDSLDPALDALPLTWPPELCFDPETINHGAGEFVRDDVTTNGIESVFAVMKRGLLGVYHHASPKHLGRYVDESAFRPNEGNVKLHTLLAG